MKLHNEITAIVKALESGERFSFEQRVSISLQKKTGIYTIWRHEGLEYVGVSANLHERLEKHRSGSRSGDKFNIYVADKRLLASLTSEQILRISNGVAQFDQIIATYVQKHYTYRYYFNDELADIKKEDFCKLETVFKKQGLGAAGRPFLNGRK